MSVPTIFATLPAGPVPASLLDANFAYLASSQIVQITAAQVASPSAAILANLNATYQLNVAPYTRYYSTGTALAAVTARSL